MRNRAEAKDLSPCPACTTKIVEIYPTHNSLPVGYRPAALSLVQEAGGRLLPLGCQQSDHCRALDFSLACQVTSPSFSHSQAWT